MSGGPSLRAPFPYFGGKSKVAHEVWRRFGDVPNYVEPFCGSAAVLLARPTASRIETLNDANCFISNFWRAISSSPEEVAALCDWPINEADLHARHRWLMLSGASLEWRERMKRDPEYFDAKIAAWWVWGACQWIGAGWCDGTRIYGEGNARHGKMPRVDVSQGINVLHPPGGASSQQAEAEPPDPSTTVVWRKRPNLGSRKGVHAAGGGFDVAEQLPDLVGDSGAAGRGIHASGLSHKMPYLDNGDRGVNRQRTSHGGVLAWFNLLSQRLRRVRVVCGDWARVVTPACTTGIGVTGVLLDPPYSDAANRQSGIYAVESLTVAHEVRAWCIERGGDPKLRIALCGYAGEHEDLEEHGWRVHVWKTGGGYANQNKGGQGMLNAKRERIWFSPHCMRGQEDMFETEAVRA